MSLELIFGEVKERHIGRLSLITFLNYTNWLNGLESTGIPISLGLPAYFPVMFQRYMKKVI